MLQYNHIDFKFTLYHFTSTYTNTSNWYRIMVMCNAYLQMHKNAHVIDQFDTFVVVVVAVLFDLAGVNS